MPAESLKTPFQWFLTGLADDEGVRMVSLLESDRLEDLRITYGIW